MSPLQVDEVLFSWWSCGVLWSWLWYETYTLSILVDTYKRTTKTIGLANGTCTKVSHTGDRKERYWWFKQRLELGQTCLESPTTYPTCCNKVLHAELQSDMSRLILYPTSNAEIGHFVPDVRSGKKSLRCDGIHIQTQLRGSRWILFVSERWSIDQLGVGPKDVKVAVAVEQLHMSALGAVGH